MLILRVRAVRVRPAMTRPQYAPVPRGYVRVWVYCDASKHLHVHMKKRNALYWARYWGVKPSGVTPLDVPAGAIPGLAARRERKR